MSLRPLLALALLILSLTCSYMLVLAAMNAFLGFSFFSIRHPFFDMLDFVSGASWPVALGVIWSLVLDLFGYAVAAAYLAVGLGLPMLWLLWLVRGNESRAEDGERDESDRDIAGVAFVIPVMFGLVLFLLLLPLGRYSLEGLFFDLLNPTNAFTASVVTKTATD